MKKSELLIHATTWMSLKNINERRKIQKAKYSMTSFIKLSRKLSLTYWTVIFMI